MTVHLHHLRGCAPAPLAHYLKAIGILRVVARQKDAEARGFWRDQHFCLLSTLDHDELEAFFLEEYAPTPIFNPWGARSGFYAGASESTARSRVEAIEKSSTPRLERFRADIKGARDVVARFGGKKPNGEKSKADLVIGLRSVLRGAAGEWLDTVTAVVDGSLKNPALMGTGGNEGSGGYGSVYLASVIDCVLSSDPARIRGNLRHSLFGAPEQKPGSLWDEPFGQFLPSGNGGSWDLLLAFEGAVCFR